MRRNLVKRMAELNINQTELARKLGVHRTTVNKWVDGTRTPRVDELESLHKTLGLVFDPYKLLENDERK